MSRIFFRPLGQKVCGVGLFGSEARLGLGGDEDWEGGRILLLYRFHQIFPKKKEGKILIRFIDGRQLATVCGDAGGRKHESQDVKYKGKKESLHFSNPFYIEWREEDPAPNKNARRKSPKNRSGASLRWGVPALSRKCELYHPAGSEEALPLRPAPISLR